MGTCGTSKQVFCTKAKEFVQTGMTLKSLPSPPRYPDAKVPVLCPEGKPPGEAPSIASAAAPAHETFGPDLQLAPLTLPYGSDRSEIKVETRQTSSGVYISGIIQVARSRATLISKIREHLLRGETKQAISQARILCGLES